MIQPAVGAVESNTNLFKRESGLKDNRSQKAPSQGRYLNLDSLYLKGEGYQG